MAEEEEMSWGAIFGATAAYMDAKAAEDTWLRTLPPEKMQEILAERRRKRELESLEVEPELVLARQYIEQDSLKGEHAERLLEFARELARRRTGTADEGKEIG